MRGEREVLIAAVEADMAKVALATEGVEVVEVLALRCLNKGILSVGDAERVFEALGRIDAGLGAGRRWMQGVRYGDGSGGAEPG